MLNRDAGLGDGFHCPLPNRYSIDAIDTLDEAKLLPAYSALPTIGSVRMLQLSGPFLFGAAFEYKEGIPRYFALDTRTGKQDWFKTLNDLQRAAPQYGATIALEPIGDIYRRYRFTWFDAFALIVLLAGPAFGLWKLGVRLWYARKEPA